MSKVVKKHDFDALVKRIKELEAKTSVKTKETIKKKETK